MSGCPQPISTRPCFAVVSPQWIDGQLWPGLCSLPGAPAGLSTSCPQWTPSYSLCWLPLLGLSSSCPGTTSHKNDLHLISVSGSADEVKLLHGGPGYCGSRVSFVSKAHVCSDGLSRSELPSQRCARCLLGPQLLSAPLRRYLAFSLYLFF